MNVYEILNDRDEFLNRRHSLAAAKEWAKERWGPKVTKFAESHGGARTRVYAKRRTGVEELLGWIVHPAAEPAGAA